MSYHQAVVSYSLLLCCIILTVVSITTTASYHDYCVIGAGPGGLQIGYFLERSHRDYIVFERANVSGSFYTKYPRHRTLISINKRHTGKTNKEFNMRHDWNSLLSDDESLLLQHYSKEMFPHADVLVKYLDDYQKKLGIKVQFNTNVRNIERKTSTSDRSNYQMEDQNGNVYTCRVLIVATGIATPNIPQNVPGMEYTEGYEDISINPDDFEGQSVLILGRGNSAFETANSIYGATNVIHMVGRSRVRLAWATHYVGDLRAVNNALLDTYQLKSLDGVIESTVDEVQFVKEGDKLVIKFRDDEDDIQYGIDNFALREPYDRIIRCLGFKFDMEIFKNNTRVSSGRSRSKKYPNILHNYESFDNPHMYFAGTNTHSLDFRKSAGGFIHGFRYTARALHRLLEWKYEQVPWPSMNAPITELINMIFKRLNEASGTYQMFAVLGDIIILKNDGLEFEYLEEFPLNLLHQIEEKTGHSAQKIIAVVLQYGTTFSGPGKDVFSINRATGEPAEAHHSNFLHPVFYYYDSVPTEAQMKSMTRQEILPKPKLMHHIVEDFLTIWDAPVSHILPLRRFIEKVLGHDLRHFFAENCLKMALTHSKVPLSCQQDFMQGHGLTGTQTLWTHAKLAGFV